MHIHCLEMHISLPCFSLKEKRGIIKSILHRARNRFNVACAEVDRQDNPRVADLAFITVSPDKAFSRKTLEQVEEWVYDNWPDIEITGAHISEV